MSAIGPSSFFSKMSDFLVLPAIVRICQGSKQIKLLIHVRDEEGDRTLQNLIALEVDVAREARCARIGYVAGVALGCAAAAAGSTIFAIGAPAIMAAVLWLENVSDDRPQLDKIGQGKQLRSKGARRRRR